MARQAQAKSKTAGGSSSQQSKKSTATPVTGKRSSSTTGGKKSNNSNGTAGNSNSKTRASQTNGGEQHGSMLEKLFTDMLKDMYWAEQHLVPALKEMQTAATTPELQDAFEDHIYATQKHAARLEKVFGLLGEKPQAKKCEAMEGLTKEAKSIMEETKEGTMTRDVGLIIAAQKVEHYEIATYGSLVALARTIDREDVARILEKTLWEEEDTDQLLTDIAESDVNPLADEEESDDDEEEDEDTMPQYTGGDSLGSIL